MFINESFSLGTKRHGNMPFRLSSVHIVLVPASQEQWERFDAPTLDRAGGAGDLGSHQLQRRHPHVPEHLTAMMFGNKEKANFTVENEKEISTAPKVDFNPPQASAK
jgi:hypothetical protein